MADQYHHGDLKTALIETGIRMISENGEDNLSLRKVAAACGVSRTAPYSHFEDKDDMIKAMQDHVTDAFMDKLRPAAAVMTEDPEEALRRLGKAYIRFFVEHPEYYTFLFARPRINVSLDIKNPAKSNYPPFALLREVVIKCNESSKERLTDQQLEERLIRKWAGVHGMASIATMKGVKWSRDWDEEVERLIK